jgi:ankyrin repeat protein
MPKTIKNGKRQGTKASPAQTDDGFDDMLAEVCAADLTISAATSVRNPIAAAANTTTSSSSSLSTPRVPGRPPPSPAAPETEEMVSGSAIVDACKRGDTAQLRRWGRQGFRVTIGNTLCYLAYNGAPLDVLRCLVNDLGANVNQTTKSSVGALHLAAEDGNVDLVSCLAKELGANEDGVTSLWLAASLGNLDMVRCLLKLKANVNQAAPNGVTPLMSASFGKHEEVVVWLVKAGADTQATFDSNATAAILSSQIGASTSQTAYLEAKEHCSNPGCGGAGLKKCPACKQARYCGEPCQLAHWKAHKADCKRWGAELAAGKDKDKGRGK